MTGWAPGPAEVIQNLPGLFVGLFALKSASCQRGGTHLADDGRPCPVIGENGPGPAMCAYARSCPARPVRAASACSALPASDGTNVARLHVSSRTSRRLTSCRIGAARSRN